MSASVLCLSTATVAVKLKIQQKRYPELREGLTISLNSLWLLLLLGDSAYPLLPWLMTPKMNASTRQEDRYNAAHKKGRSTVERCNGLLKARFRCLTQPMMYSPLKSSRIILACGVLHNIAIERRVHIDFTDDIPEMNHDSDIYYGANENRNAVQTRARLIEGVFQ